MQKTKIRRLWGSVNGDDSAEIGKCVINCIEDRRLQDG